MGQNRIVILLGGGGHAAVVADAARAAGWTVAGFLDDADRAGPPGVPRLGALTDLAAAQAAHPGAAVHAAFGDAALRRAALAQAGPIPGGAATIIHPSAILSPSLQHDDAVFIGPGAIVNARARLGRGAIVNSGAVVEHDAAVGAFAHVAPRAVLAGGVRVGDDALVGVGAAVRPRTSIGDGATVGAGAVVVDDVEAGVTVVGVPARPLIAAAAR